MKTVNAKDIQEKVTAKVIAALESGKAQGSKWVKPWRAIGGGEAKRFDGYVYQGMNQWLLTMTANMGGKQNFWGTPKQWGDLAKKRGETFDFRGSKCIGEVLRPNTAKFEKTLTDDKGNEEKASFFVVRSFSVFPVMSISDVRGTEKLLSELMEKDKLTEHETNAQAEAFIAAQKAVVEQSNQASYSPTLDRVNMPVLGQFNKAADYYATYIHELTHRTGHKDRLNRDGIARFDHFGSEQYAFEELIAEFGSAFVCNMLGIDGETQDNHVQYLDSWLKKLRSDSKAIFNASRAASAAMDYMLVNAGMKPAKAEAGA